MSEAVKSLECCIADIRIWMLRNRLKIKGSKTEMTVFPSARVKLPDLCVAVGGEYLQSAHQLRNIGVPLDVHLTMNVHIKRVCQISYFQLKMSCRLCNSLHYCNSPLIGTHVAAIQKLQLLQN